MRGLDVPKSLIKPIRLARASFASGRCRVCGRPFEKGDAIVKHPFLGWVHKGCVPLTQKEMENWLRKYWRAELPNSPVVRFCIRNSGTPEEALEKILSRVSILNAWKPIYQALCLGLLKEHYFATKEYCQRLKEKLPSLATRTLVEVWEEIHKDLFRSLRRET